MKNTESLFWIKQQFNDANLKDKRLKSRLNKIASNMMAKPSQSIPKQNGGWNETKAAYRFFDSSKVSFRKLTRPHINETKQEAKNRKIVLAIQDTTFISYSHYRCV